MILKKMGKMLILKIYIEFKSGFFCPGWIFDGQKNWKTKKHSNVIHFDEARKEVLIDEKEEIRINFRFDDLICGISNDIVRKDFHLVNGILNIFLQLYKYI